MRRRAFLDQNTIDASRNFVCVRLNAWQDELNIQRIVKLQGAHQNSSLALLAPDAPGVAKDSFPHGKDCAWGPLDFNAGDLDKPWEELEKRPSWLPVAMRKLSTQYPGKAPEDGSHQLLPVFPDLKQVLNIAACDCAAVIVEVANPADVDVLDVDLLAVVLEPKVIGRAHLVRVSPREWRDAMVAGQIKVNTNVDWRGIFVVEPDPYGLEGTVLTNAPGVPSVAEIRMAVGKGLDKFAQTFHKKDRSTHIIEGRAKGVRWKEVPATGWRKYLEEPAAESPAPACENEMSEQ